MLRISTAGLGKALPQTGKARHDQKFAVSGRGNHSPLRAKFAKTNHGPEMLSDSESVRKQLSEQLTTQFGSMVSGQDLLRLLGFTTTDALRRAAKRGKLQVPVFRVPGRPGNFALTLDLVDHIISLRQ